MKKLITTVVMVLLISACGTTAYLTPGITASNFSKAQEACKDHQGVHMVNVSAGGFNAFCNDDERVDI